MGDWSSDVCSSDLWIAIGLLRRRLGAQVGVKHDSENQNKCVYSHVGTEIYVCLKWCLLRNYWTLFSFSALISVMISFICFNGKEKTLANNSSS